MRIVPHRLNLFKKRYTGEESDEGVFMTEISGPTIPLPVFPKLGYKLVHLGKNWSYGIAALIFAAIEYKRCLDK